MDNQNVRITVGKTPDCLFKDLQTALMFISERPETAFDIDIYSFRHQKVIDEARLFGIGYRRKRHE